MNTAKSLVEYITDELKLNYISDLRSRGFDKVRLSEIIKLTNENDFPLSEWREAIQYLFPAQAPSSEACASVAQAKTALLKMLK